MRSRFVRLFVVCAAAAAFGTLVVLQAAISLSTSTPSTENFDGIGTVAVATLPADFKADKVTTVRSVGSFSTAQATTTLLGGANLSGTASNGIYNFGAGTTTTGPDRAVGFLSSGTATQSGNLYAQYVNSTGQDLAGLKISYDVEKYRTGSNGAGFCIQLYYSTTGQTGSWTSAGASFLTQFAADAANAGYATAPGDVKSIANQTLSLAVPNNASLYLAWNYSVCSGSTTTNAQALAIDNISILGIAGSVPPAPTNPGVTGSASPSALQPGSGFLLTATVTPGTNPASTGVTVMADLSSVSGSGSQALFDDGTHGDTTAGDHTFSVQVQVPAAVTSGVKSLPLTVSDSQGRTGGGSAAVTILPPPPPATIKISQVYGGGGNSGSTYTNDFIEIFNQGPTVIDLSGWSVQYHSAGSDNTPWQVTPVCPAQPCAVQPGRYFLVAESQGPGGTTALPLSDVSGSIQMSGTNGKVALVDTTTPLPGTASGSGCGTTGTVVDAVGYGSASCFEALATSALSNTTAAVRRGNGCTDTGNNSSDFVLIGPIPRNSASPVNSCGGDPSQPYGLGLASPSSLDPASNVRLSVKVTPASTPPSTGIVVSADLTSIGGSATQTFHDDGTNGDETAADGTFSFLTTVGAFVPTGAKSIVATVTDAQARSVTAPITLTVTSPTCGVERWSVKVGTDPDAQNVDLSTPITTTTIAQLGLIPPPPDPPGPPANARFDANELSVFQFHATLVRYKKEADVDYHIVLQDDDGHTMIAEIPSPACVLVANPNGPGRILVHGPFSDGIAKARAQFDARLSATDFFQPPSPESANIPVRVKGVGFFDFAHGQTGIAPNAIELHPVLEIAFTHNSVATFQSTLNPSTYGQDVTITAEVSNGTSATPTGNITLYDNGTALSALTLDSTGHAALNIASLGVGSHTITMSYEGDDASTPITTKTTPVMSQVVLQATPAFSGLTSRTLEAGTPSLDVIGKLSADGVVPPGDVSITLNGITQTAAIGTDGTFSSSFDTSNLAPRAMPYEIAYAYAGDTNFQPASGTGGVTVVDTTPPVISGVAATPGTLGPPDHKMIDVTLAYVAADTGLDGRTFVSTPSCVLSVVSNEPANGTGDGDTAPDWVLIDVHHLQLRAERAGTGGGRIYTVSVACTDPSGNAASKSATVTVPK